MLENQIGQISSVNSSILGRRNNDTQQSEILDSRQAKSPLVPEFGTVQRVQDQNKAFNLESN